MKVFISHGSSRRDAKLAESLAKTLDDHGVATWFDTRSLKSGLPFEDEVRNAVRGADDIVVIIGPESDSNHHQQLEWRATLEAVWNDPKKRLIPVLIGNADIPPIVRSSVPPGREIEVIRINDPRQDWPKVLDGLVEALRSRTDLGKIGHRINTTTADRVQQRKRLTYLKRAAKTFEPS